MVRQSCHWWEPLSIELLPVYHEGFDRDVGLQPRVPGWQDKLLPPPSVIPTDSTRLPVVTQTLTSEFSISDLRLTIFFLLLLWCLLSAFRFQWGCSLYQWGFNCLSFHHCNPLEYIHGRHMCLLVLVHGPLGNTLSSCTIPCFEKGATSCCLNN